MIVAANDVHSTYPTIERKYGERTTSIRPSNAPPATGGSPSPSAFTAIAERRTSATPMTATSRSTPDIARIPASPTCATSAFVSPGPPLVTSVPPAAIRPNPGQDFPVPGPSDVLLIRHAAAFAETLAVRVPNRHLTAEGRAQARALGDRLRWHDCEPTLIWSSPLVRAIQPAELVALALGLTTVVE